MYLIQQITADPLQELSIILPTGDTFALTLYFISLQQGWFINNLTYKDFVLNGVRICVCPNMLNQFRNQIPFGLACLSIENREPSQLEDFSSSAASLYVLSTEEVAAYAQFLSTGKL